MISRRLIAIAVIVLPVILINSCNQQEAEKAQELITEKSDVAEARLSQGFQLLEDYCFTCHSPKGGPGERVAPPMAAIKRHYISEETTKEEFTEDLVQWIQNPSEGISKMPGAIERFGVMPKMDFSEEQITAIAEYLYEKEIETPGWFEEHYQRERKRHRRGQGAKTDPTELGRKFAMATKAVLGKNLMGAIQSKGSAGAVEFCNTRAIHLTDSMGGVQGVAIKRVSDQPRNQHNVANEEQVAYIRWAKELLNKGQEPKAQLTERGNKITGYYPIVTNQMCLQCHGQPGKDINTATLEKLQKLYPEDKATGYSQNELRGIWVVEMEKS